MSPKATRLLLLFPWSFLILLALGYAVVWSDLPEEMTIHFGFQGEPNGWIGRNAFLSFSFLFLLLELSVFTTLLMHLRFAKVYKRIMALFYFYVTAETALFWQIIQYNISPTRLSWMWLFVAIVIVVTLSLCAFRLAHPFEISASGSGPRHNHT